jgi:hypothetical protein
MFLFSELLTDDVFCFTANAVLLCYIPVHAVDYVDVWIAGAYCAVPTD